MSSDRTLRLPVDVYADLDVDTPAGRVAVTSDGRTVTVAADRYETFRRLGAPLLESDRAVRSRSVARLREFLNISDTRVIFTLQSSEIARIEAGTRGGLLSRVLGLPGVRVRPISLFRALLRRP